MNRLKNAKACADAGNDITVDDRWHLICDTNNSRTPINAADFLYQLLVPYGSYLNYCLGSLVTRENDRKILYTSCSDLQTPERLITGPIPVRPNLRPKTLDITDCSDMDIAYNNRSLRCEGEKNLPEGVAPYLPPGNYLLTCGDIKFMPCEGNGGRLTAKCLNSGQHACIDSGQHSLVSATMNSGSDDLCQVGRLGYISNIDGNLRCDPDIMFQSITEELNEDLIRYFQCNK